MKHMSITQPTKANQPTLLTRAVVAGRNAWHNFWLWRARQATVRILHSLDCRTLHDIGINPSEIESHVFGEARHLRRRPYDEIWRSRTGT